MAVDCPHCGSLLTNEQIQKLSSPLSLCPHCQGPIEPSSLAPSAATEPTQPRAIKYGLEVLDGNEPGKIYPLEKTQTTIGRKTCDIHLADPEISRRHAALTLDGDQAHLEDLGSANGTYVLGQRIDERVPLKPGSTFRLGTHQLIFILVEGKS